MTIRFLRNLFGLVVVFCVWGCGSKAGTHPDSFPLSGSTRQGKKKGTISWGKGGLEVEQVGERCQWKRLTREALRHYQSKGPGALLKTLEVSRFPESRQEAFIGWRLDTINDPCLRGAVLAGDVVLQVNGRSLKTPSDLWAVWRQLDKAFALEVVIQRQGEQRKLAFPVVSEE